MVVTTMAKVMATVQHHNNHGQVHTSTETDQHLNNHGRVHTITTTASNHGQLSHLAHQHLNKLGLQALDMPRHLLLQVPGTTGTVLHKPVKQPLLSILVVHKRTPQEFLLVLVLLLSSCKTFVFIQPLECR